LPPDETLLEYFAAGPALYLMVIDHDGVAAYKLDGAQLARQSHSAGRCLTRMSSSRRVHCMTACCVRRRRACAAT
jgi:hypothetical protein